MKDLKQASLIAALVAAGAFGCSSSNGGSSGTGGHNATGGSPGSGGQAAGGSGAKACGGPAPAPDAGVCQQAPCDGLIANFDSPDGGISIVGGLTSWSGILKPTYTTDNGMLNVMEDVVQASQPQYLGTTLFFNNCVDASAFTGVQFTISGSVSAACQVIFGANDVVHDDKASDTAKGQCDAGSACYAPNMPIPMQVTSTPTVMQIPWITGSSVPAVPLDPSHLVGVQWQFTVGPTADGGTPQECTADLHIDDVKFY